MATQDEGLTLEQIQAMGGKPHTEEPAAGEGLTFEQLKAMGATPHVEAPAQPQAPKAPTGDPTSLDQKIRSGFQGATYGFGDDLVRNAESALPSDSAWRRPLADTIDRALHPKEYTEAPAPAQTDQQTAQMYKDAVKDNPGSNMAGAVFAPGPKGLSGGGALKTIANGAIQGGVGGFAQGLGDSEADTLGGKLQDAGKQGVVGGVAGGVLGPLVHGLGAGAKFVGKSFNSTKEALLAKEAERLEKPLADAVKTQSTAKDRLKKKIYDEYVRSITKSGTSPDEASKILQANESQIQDGIEDEYRKALFGKHASEKKDLFTKIRNAEQMGAQWTPEQVEKTVSPAKAQYVQDAAATVDKGLPVPPEKMSPEALKAEVLKRGRAAQAKAVRSISTPPPSLDPALVEELAQKRLAAQEASGVSKGLPVLHPMQSPDASLTAKGKTAASDLALKAGGAALATGVGLKAGGPIGASIGAGLGLAPQASGMAADWNSPGLQYLRAKAGDTVLNSVPARLGRGALTGGAELVNPAVRTQVDKDKLDQLRALFAAFGNKDAE